MKNIVMMFPGQGSQYVGMGSDHAEADPTEEVEELYSKVSESLGSDLIDVCRNGPAEKLNETQVTQPAVVLNSVASFLRFTKKTGLKPVAMAGHSVGEISALICAGAIDAVDGIRLAQMRGQLMSACSEGTGMVAVLKLSREKVEEICTEFQEYGCEFVIANFNTDKQLVISGAMEVLGKVSEKLKAAGASTVQLRVSGAFHSPFMKPAANDLEQIVSALEIKNPRIPVVANFNAEIYQSAEDIKDWLVKQLYSPVLWERSIDKILSRPEELALLGPEIDLFVDMGPGILLKKMGEKIHKDKPSYAIDEGDDMAALERLLEVDIRTIKMRPTFLGKCLAVAVSTRNSNFDNSSYEENVLKPYQKLKGMHESTADKAQEISKSEIQTAFNLLKEIIISKGRSESEFIQRRQEIIVATSISDQLTG